MLLATAPSVERRPVELVTMIELKSLYLTREYRRNDSSYVSIAGNHGLRLSGGLPGIGSVPTRRIGAQLLR